jgi:hypothetical protein
MPVAAFHSLRHSSTSYKLILTNGNIKAVQGDNGSSQPDAMSPSVKKTYTRAYFDAKTDAGHKKRLSWMIERLKKNLKPME